MTERNCWEGPLVLLEDSQKQKREGSLGYFPAYLPGGGCMPFQPDWPLRGPFIAY
jgi:hypothetical protein